jgi:cytochrome c553
MRYVVLIFFAVLSVVALGFTYIYFGSESVLGNVYPDLEFDAPIPSTEAVRNRGSHIARTRGCFGCHGQQLEGRVFTDQWEWSDRSVAPNLAKIARAYSVPELEAAIRQGIGKNGRALWSMPSYNWAHLSDGDLVALIAFLRTADVVHTELPKPNLGWKARWAIVRGQEEHMAKWADDVPPLRLTSNENPVLVQGEYLAMTSCNECHGLDLRGAFDRDGGTPDLAIVSAYSESEFQHLMREGIAKGGRENLPLMSMVARDRFAAFTEQETSALYAFLTSLVNQPVQKNVHWRE